MKAMIVPVFVALMAIGPAPKVHAQTKTETVFTCAIGPKTASVTRANDQLTYHFGTGKKDEITIIGIPSAGNIFLMIQRYAGIEVQFRFKNGDFSYIVYTMGGNVTSGASAISGLVVMQGTKRISDHSCAKFADITTDYSFLGLPEDTDTDTYSAM